MRSRYFLIALAVIIFIAMLQYPPRLPSLMAGASPANNGWDGTSEFLKLLQDEGYKVYLITDWCNAFKLVKSINESVIVVIISPEEPYSRGEVDCLLAVIHHSLYVRGSASILIADEGPYTNSILSLLGLQMKIISKSLATSVNGDPYPLAKLRVPGDGMYYLLLNYVAKLDYWGSAGLAGTTRKGDVVAAYLVKGGLKAYVISDGSVFINEVMRLNSSKYDYRGFAKSLMKWLGSPSKYVVMIEGAKYVSPASKLLNEIKASLMAGVDIGKLLALFIALLHPMIWFPIFHNLALNADMRLRELILTNEVFRLASVGAAALLIIYVLKRVLGVRYSVTDESLKPVSEVDIIIDTPVRREVVTGKVKLGKEDLMALYDIVNEVLKKTLGKGLEDPEVIHALVATTGLEEEFIRKYVSRLRRLNEKVREGKFLPIVLFWNRTVRKLIEDSDEVLKRLGTALSEEVGIERLIRR